MLIYRYIFAFAFAVFAAKGALSDNNARLPAVGAIRWDAWHTHWSQVDPKAADGPVRAMEISLSPKPYHERAPFFAMVVSDNEIRIDGYTQKIMDREIAYAKAGRLDYWAFLLYDPGISMSQGLSLYLSSKHKRDVGFCAIASPPTFGDMKTFTNGVARIVKLMREPSYQRVANGRPLLYLFDVSDAWLAAWGGAEGARKLFDGLRAEIVANGCGDPYIVVMEYDPARGKRLMEIVGAQGISAYVWSGNGANTPYAELANGARAFWDACAATGAQVVPIAVAGWDRRPRVEHPVPWETWQKAGEGMDRYYQRATPVELADHIKQAMKWAADRPLVCPAQAVLTYAWNEHDEGGWLCPTLNADGSANADRLKAISAMKRNW